jgi:hypothetical protein
VLEETLQEIMEVLNHSASIQSVVNQYDIQVGLSYVILKKCKRTLEFMLKQDDRCSNQAKKWNRTTGTKENKFFRSETKLGLHHQCVNSNPQYNTY